MSDLSVFYEATPNPNSMKFLITHKIADEVLNVSGAVEATRSPLAQKIMGFPWAAGVFIGPTFVTITKQDWVDWDVIAEPLSDLIKEHLDRGEPVILPSSANSTMAAMPDVDDPNEEPIVRTIKRVLREEIRPAVAMDGGDITFSKYEEGRVYLHMHGACAGCPSSTYTLKEGIEVRLKEIVPEITEVIAV